MFFWGGSNCGYGFRYGSGYDWKNHLCFFMVLNIVFYGFGYVFLGLIWFGRTVVGPGGMEGAYPNHIVNHIFLKIKKLIFKSQK